MAVVAFVYADWIARYPEFPASIVTQAQATDCFTQATFYLDNTDASQVQDVPTRTFLLYLLTAHLAQINFGSTLQPNSPLVGRIESAAQGSVNLTVKAPDAGGMAGWLQQTKYGAQYWQATARYRTFRYAPAPCRPRRLW